jgi:hypothetical protein
VKRTGFKSKWSPRPAKQIDYTPTPRPVAVARSDVYARMSVPVPKREYVRSEAYRRLVAALNCCACDVAGHSQAAHPNSPAAGKGLGIKADDRLCFPLCGASGNDCHRAFDQGAMFDKDTRRRMEAAWAERTQRVLREVAGQDRKAAPVIERVLG